MKTSKEDEKYIQTDLVSFFSNYNENKDSTIKRNLNQLNHYKPFQEIFKYQNTKDSISQDSLQNVLNKNWKSFEKEKYYITNDHSMVAGNIEDYKNLVKTRNIPEKLKLILKISNSNDLKKLLPKKDKGDYIKIHNFYYHRSNLIDISKILEIPFFIYQNKYGLLVCNNQKIFVLVPPTKK